MRYGVLIALAATVFAGALVGCGGVDDPTTAAQYSDGRQVVTSTGLPEIEIGASRADLVRDQGLTQGPGDCAPLLPNRPAASPVFEDDRLVLLWANPPLRTPDGVAVGSPVVALRAQYPDAEPLSAAPGSHQYDGLLVTVDEHAYLFLHDQQQVQKLIVGSAEHARRLFHEGFGTC